MGAVMTDEVKKESEVVVVVPVPDKIVIDPLSKPIELAKDLTNAVVKGAKKAGKTISRWFK